MFIFYFSAPFLIKSFLVLHSICLSAIDFSALIDEDQSEGPDDFYQSEISDLIATLFSNEEPAGLHGDQDDPWANPLSADFPPESADFHVSEFVPSMTAPVSVEQVNEWL